MVTLRWVVGYHHTVPSLRPLPQHLARRTTDLFIHFFNRKFEGNISFPNFHERRAGQFARFEPICAVFVWRMGRRPERDCCAIYRPKDTIEDHFYLFNERQL